MVRIGIVGVGFMGMIHFLAARKLRDAKVAAVCSRDATKLAGDWRSIQGNFGPRGQIMDLSGMKKYQRLDDLLSDKDIDLIDVCNPTSLHADTTIRALKAGKHVLVEKCIALDARDADAMRDAARQANRLLMVAHVLPFVPEFAWAASAIRDGRNGKVLAGHFKRVICKPDWSAAIGDAAQSGGPGIDLHIHDAHFIGLVCGVPARVFAVGTQENGVVTHLTTSYLYEPAQTGPAITCSSGALAQKGRPFVHGFEIYLERATLVFESGAIPLTVYTADGKMERPTLAGGDDPINAFTAEIETAVQGVLTGKEPDFLSAQLARDALVLCHKECESVRTGQIVSVR
jgi:predicted dehydrogenase